MNNILKEIPWSHIKIFKYILKEYKSGHNVDAIDIRNHFNMKATKEQPYLELLKLNNFINNTGSFFENSYTIYTFSITTKALVAFESVTENIIIFLFSSLIVPALISIIAAVITTLLIKK
ncbi:hypothetical protein LABALGNA3A7_01830 [Dellaglioa algida]|nr:hypothetical protein LABALGNA3A7_01830 [Dellaglioa algida]